MSGATFPAKEIADVLLELKALMRRVGAEPRRPLNSRPWFHLTPWRVSVYWVRRWQVGRGEKARRGSAYRTFWCDLGPWRVWWSKAVPA